MASTLILLSLFIPRFIAVRRIQAVSRSYEGPAPGHDDNAEGRKAFTGERLADTSGLRCHRVQAKVLHQIWIRPGSGRLRENLGINKDAILLMM